MSLKRYSMSAEVSASMSSSNKQVPKFGGNYAIWQPHMVAFMMKSGIKISAYQLAIPRWNEMEQALQNWETQRINDAISAEIDGHLASSSSSSSSSSSTVNSAARADEETARRRAIRDLVESSQKAYGHLYEALPAELRLLIQSVPTGYAYGVWKFMEDKFQNTEQDNIATLYKKWHQLTIGESESFDSYKARVDDIYTLLGRAKDQPSHGQYQCMVLDGAAVQPKLQQAILALKASSASGDAYKLRDPALTNWAGVVSFINAHERSEDRITDAKAEREEQLQQAHAATRTWNKVAATGSQWTMNKSNPDIECHHCHEKGHIRPHCEKLKQLQQSPSNGSSGGTGAYRSGSNSSKPRCAKCRSSNHSTADHDDSKVPVWRRQRQAARANAATADADRDSASMSANGDEEEAKSTEAKTRSVPKLRSANAILIVKNRFGPLFQHNDSKAVWASCALSCSSIKSELPSASTATPLYGLKQSPHQWSKLNGKLPEHHLMANASKQDLDVALSDKKWGLDTMASESCCGNRANFVGQLKPCRPIHVKVADGSIVTVKERGTVEIVVESADKKKLLRYLLHNVLYHKSFCVNLISWLKLKKLKWELHSAGDKTYLITPAKNQIALSTDEDVVVLDGIIDPDEAKATRACAMTATPGPTWKTVDDLVMMHERLGHMSFDTMMKVLKANQTDGVGVVSMNDEAINKARETVLNCTACMEAKGTRTAFGHRGLDHGSRPLEVLHMDSYQVIHYGSEGQKRREYAVVIIDPFTEFVQFTCTSSKDLIPDSIVNVLRSNMTQFGCQLKRLYCDGGTEFINSKIKDWCRRHGVEIHYPPAATPQLNGISERYVRTLKDGARTLEIRAGLPDRYWSYATTHFVSLQNRVHVATATGKTPHEAVYGRKPSLQHFAVYGCDVYYHVPKKDRPATMQAKMQPGIYLGFDSVHNCSRIYRLHTRDVITTRDVKFIHNSFQHATALKNGLVQELLDGELPNYRGQALPMADEDEDENVAADGQQQSEQSEAKYPEHDIDEMEIMNRGQRSEADAVNGAQSQGGQGLVRRRANVQSSPMAAAEPQAEAPAQSRPQPQQRSGVLTRQQQQRDEAEQRRADEQQAIDEALAISALKVACAIQSDQVVPHKPSGMHKLEQETPKTYKEALLSKRREE